MGKKIKGKKRHIGVDTIGLMHALVVLPASYRDHDVIALLLQKATARVPTLERALADGGSQGEATVRAVKAEAGIRLEIVNRTFGWFGRCRRLAKDFENLSRTHAAFDPGHDSHHAAATSPR